MYPLVKTLKPCNPCRERESDVNKTQCTVFFPQARAAFEILTLLFAFFYILILIREIIFQEGIKSVFWGLVRFPYY